MTNMLKGKWQLLSYLHQVIVPVPKNNPWKFGVHTPPHYWAGAPVTCQFEERGSPERLWQAPLLAGDPLTGNLSALRHQRGTPRGLRTGCQRHDVIVDMVGTSDSRQNDLVFLDHDHYYSLYLFLPISLPRGSYHFETFRNYSRGLWLANGIKINQIWKTWHLPFNNVKELQLKC